MPCTGGKILAIGKEKVVYYNANLEEQETVEISNETLYSKQGAAYISAIAVNETHIAWFAKDRSVYVTNVRDWSEVKIATKVSEENPLGLFDAIYKTNSADQMIISGNIYKDGEDPSISAEDKIVHVVANGKQGTIEDVLYDTELEKTRALMSPETKGIYQFSDTSFDELLSLKKLEERYGSKVLQNGVVSNFLAAPNNTTPFGLFDLTNQKHYFISGKTNEDLNLMASYTNGTNAYFILVGADGQTNYLVRI